MTQPSPTPVPDHGTGWGLLFLFVTLYGVVALLGIGTIVALAADRVGRRMPPLLQYLVVTVLLGALGVSGFIVLVAASAGQYDIVALLLLLVVLPLALVVLRRRRTARGRVALLAGAARAWSLPFLAGVGVLAVAGTLGGGVSPEASGAVAVIVVVAGTVGIDRLSFGQRTERREN